MKRFIVLIGILSLLLTAGCHNMKKDMPLENAEGERPEKLVVYLSASAHRFSLSDSENEFTRYPSKYNVGTMAVGGETEAANGNIFEQALKEYEKETGITIEVHYIEEHDVKGDIFQQMYEEKAAMPDLLIMGKHPRYDYYRLAKQGLLLDFTPYMVKDESIQDSELYYQQVMEGGALQNGQYALPILFNLNGLITTESFMSLIGQDASAETRSYEEVMHLLKESCIAMKEDKTIEAIYETSGYMVSGMYLPSIMTGAACPEYFDDEMKTTLLSKETIRSIFDLMKVYNEQEFAPIVGWENDAYLENVNNTGSKSRQMTFGKDLYTRIGVFLSGGRSGGVNFHNSVLTDLAFFRSVYEENDEDLVFYGIPTAESENSYSANISLAAFGLQTTKYPEAVYALSRYLMDYEFPAFYGFSINRELTEKQLKDIQSSTVKVYPYYIWSEVEAGFRSKEEVENDCMIVEPLDEKSVQKIENMLDHMAGAGLPYSILEYNMYTSMLKAVGDNQMTTDEAAQWVIDHLEEYLQVQEELEPFYDAEYNQSLRFE